MPITCLICNREFAKQINNTHLKSHGITASEYKQRYQVESLLSSEYRDELVRSRSGERNGNWGKNWSSEQREALSQTLGGKTPWNKGISTGSSRAHAEGIARREDEYASGKLTRVVGEWTDERRESHSTVMAEWNASRSSEERSSAALKAIETKRAAGTEIGGFRNKSHSDASKQLIGAASEQANAKKSAHAKDERLERIAASNLKLLSQSGVTLSLECLVCNSQFNLTQQCFTHGKWKSDWCNQCHPVTPKYRSAGEIELFDWVRSIRCDAVSSHRQLLPNRGEVDIYVPSAKLALEYNGLYWHSADVLLKCGKSPTADYEKRAALQEIGVRYVGVFEDEWLHKQEIVKSRLRSILGVTPTRIGARNTYLREVSSSDAAKFCRDNHISGAGRSSVRYGLYVDNTLVSVMTFSESNISRKISGWEINRFCTVLNTTVVGGASRLFNRFLADVKPSRVISYADSRWSEGELYRVLGFKLVDQTVPNYWYVARGATVRTHRYTLRKTADEPRDVSEQALRSAQGYSRVYDCGSTKWLWEA